MLIPHQYVGSILPRMTFCNQFKGCDINENALDVNSAPKLAGDKDELNTAEHNVIACPINSSNTKFITFGIVIDISGYIICFGLFIIL